MSGRRALKTGDNESTKLSVRLYHVVNERRAKTKVSLLKNRQLNFDKWATY